MKSDINRDKIDLIEDIERKRAVINLLGRRLKYHFLITVSIVIIFVSGVFVFLLGSNYLNSERKITKEYISQFRIRLDDAGNSNTTELVKDADLLIALSYIQERNYEKAAFLLSGNETEEGLWLRALCYIRQEEYYAAKLILIRIVELQGYYSSSAKEILDNYYKDNYNRKWNN